MPVFVSIEYQDLRSVFGGPQGPVFEAVRNAAEALRDRADRYTPVRTGRLASSLAVEMGTVNGFASARVGASNNVEYAIYVHNGTRNTRRRWPQGRPFLTRAASELFGTNFTKT
jgi:hypothetical protein